MSKHTVGEWFLRIGENKCFHNRNRVSIVNKWKDGGEKGEHTIAEVWCTSDDTDIADGRIIAQSPKLLMVCERLINMLRCEGDRCGFDADEYDEVQEAVEIINRAKGVEK